MTSNTADDGVGCRDLTFSTAAFVAFAAPSVAVGLALFLPDSSGPVAQKLGLALYAAGAPVSGLFSALAGGLPLTIFLDLLVWILAGNIAARLSERRRLVLWKTVSVGVACALVYGVVISTFIARV
jgi:hypothetical protein